MPAWPGNRRSGPWRYIAMMCLAGVAAMRSHEAVTVPVTSTRWRPGTRHHMLAPRSAGHAGPAMRRRALTSLPPGKLLPDTQPAYVASWIYVFGVGSLAALAVAIVSGFGLALGGPGWWHYNPLGK